MALAPQENKQILHSCCASRGKISYRAQVMKHTGVILANDANAELLKSVVVNLHRLGDTSTIISYYDGNQFPKVVGGFDHTEVFSKDPAVRTNKDEKDIWRCIQLQKELLFSTIDSVNTPPRQEAT